MFDPIQMALCGGSPVVKLETVISFSGTTVLSEVDSQKLSAAAQNRAPVNIEFTNGTTMFVANGSLMFVPNAPYSGFTAFIGNGSVGFMTNDGKTWASVLVAPEGA